MSVEAANNDSGHDCPTCGDSFPTEAGMKRHHTWKHGESIATVTKPCATCGEPVEREHNQAEGKERFFCDYDCMGEWTSENQNGESNPRFKSEEVPCAKCGEILIRPECKIQKNENHFCDPQCHGEWRTENVVGDDHPRFSREYAECDWCGSTFEAQRHRLEQPRQFCSRECYFACKTENATSEQRQCSWCGASVEVWGERLDYENTFCNGECYGGWISENVRGNSAPNWRGGIAGTFRYGEGWHEKKRELVRERDGRECQDCGLGEREHLCEHGQKLHVHHIIPAREFDDPIERNAMENLISLCQSCHGKWERIPGLRPT